MEQHYSGEKHKTKKSRSVNSQPTISEEYLRVRGASFSSDLANAFLATDIPF